MSTVMMLVMIRVSFTCCHVAALRRQTAGRGLFQHPAYVGYPFFMIPDLCGSYLTGGGLAAAGAHAVSRSAHDHQAHHSLSDFD